MKKPDSSVGLTERLLKSSTLKGSAMIDDSKLFDRDKPLFSTPIPMLNVALSGDPDGGLISGITAIAGPSRHFKTLYGMILAKSFLDKYKDGVLLHYVSEFGSPEGYFKALNIPTERVLVTPVTDVEELKIDLVSRLESIKEGEPVFIFVDSIGNLASRKEMDDAEEGKTVTDMSRAKALKSLFRIITPKIKLKGLPFVFINHSYKTQEMYAKTIMSGGEGGLYASDTVFIIGRQQEKDGTLLAGFDFIINVEKSRFVSEKAKIPITVTFKGGINVWSGLLENALEAGVVEKPLAGKYRKFGTEEAYKEDEIINNKEFWEDILKTTTLKDFLREKYKPSLNLLNQEEEPQDDSE